MKKEYLVHELSIIFYQLLPLQRKQRNHQKRFNLRNQLKKSFRQKRRFRILKWNQPLTLHKVVNP